MPCVYQLSLWARYLPEFINILFQKQMSLANSRQRCQRKTEGTKEAPIRFMTNLDHFESSMDETFKIFLLYRNIEPVCKVCLQLSRES